jgi:3-methylcrotonyl-CoA carboxylase alpha subunit
MPDMVQKILIANRGEIARRVIRTAHRMGLETVAVYSEADAEALHVQEAGEAVRIGEAAPTQSYLVIEKVIDAARQTGADAIHPGYGFLSENPEFAQACEMAGITLIGPSAEAMRAMGRKDAAKALMEQAGVPVTPGYFGDEQAGKALHARADAIGYPVLIKAVAGGGGKGMRRVDASEDFAEALESAKRESANAFGDDRMLLEKYILNPRHIEVQIMGDTHGRIVHFFERDCSLQRRHQKVIEEAPAPGLNPEMRTAMHEAAIRAARAVNYVNAGTIEFIVSRDDARNRADGFYFMEMNTRLQVEHPVTEMITGVDLVEWQIRVARGERLPDQGAIIATGHAVEARIYAEDPTHGFLPQSGRIEHLVEPDPETARWDAAVRVGSEVSPFYDPMIGKLIVHGETRGEAIAVLSEEVERLCIAPLRTNTGFLLAALEHDIFVDGDFDTGFVAAELETLTGADPVTQAMQSVMAAAARASARSDVDSVDPFDHEDGWRIGGRRRWFERFSQNGALASLAMDRHDDTGSQWPREGSGEIGTVRFDSLQIQSPEAGWLIGIGHSGAKTAVALATSVSHDDGLWVFVDGHLLDVRDAINAHGADAGEAGDDIRAPMPGKVQKIAVAEGAVVKKGQTLAVLEAMKMEHSLKAPRDGMVVRIGAAAGDQVKEKHLLIALAPEL